MPNALDDNDCAVERNVGSQAAMAAIKRAKWALEAEHDRRDNLRRAAQDVLAQFQDMGLQRRRGRTLAADELQVLARLLARGLGEPELRVCAGRGCAVVFEPKPRGPNQRSSVYCGRCQRSPAPKLSLRPHHGANPVVEIGSLGAPGSRQVTYEALCAGCVHGFTASRPNTRLCLNCRGGAGRVRRHRGGGSARRVFRYAHREGAREFTVSVTRGYGEQVLLKAVGGAIRTTDLEVVKVLDQYVRFGELRRVPVR